MSHFIFIFSICSLFSLVFAIITNLIFVVKKTIERQTHIFRLPLLATLFAYMLSFTSGLYLSSVMNTASRWIYELQEISIVFLIPSLVLFNKTIFPSIMKKILLYVLLIISLASLLLYIYANHINLKSWPVINRVYTYILTIIVLATFFFLLLKRKSVYNSKFHIAAVISSVIILISAIPEINLYAGITYGFFSFIEIIYRPLLILVWSIIFLLSDIESILNVMASKSSFDFSGISSNFKLSEREQEVITLLLKGKSYQDIGETLFLSKATIKTYVLRIYQKAGVNSKMELVNKIMASKGKQ